MSPKKILASELIKDIKTGMSEPELTSKYQISSSQLQSLTKKLIDAGKLKQKKIKEQLPVFRCPKCGESSNKKFNECPTCGVIIEKYLVPKKNSKKQNLPALSPKLKAKGVNGQIELYSDKVCIKRKGVLSFLTQGLKGDKSIMLSSISSIQFRKAGMMVNGYIEFAFMGGQETKKGIFQATNDENSVMFSWLQREAFERIKDEIESRIQEINRPINNEGSKISDISDADELAKFDDLRRKGIITDAEFQKKKRQILKI